MITRGKNRSSVITWSMANETPMKPERNVYIRKLTARMRSLDPTRPVSTALEQHGLPNSNTHTIGDPLIVCVDTLSFNQYIGWYDGTPDKLKNVSRKISRNKPVMESRFGAGALQGKHGDKLERFTEE